MKFHRFFILIYILLFTSASHAEGYFGIKAGPMMIDDSVSSINIARVSISLDDPTNVGIFGGSTNDNGIGFEFEATFTTSDGNLKANVQTANFAVVQLKEDVTINTIGGYATFRSSGSSYFKGKIGFVNEDIEIGNISDDDTGLSYGVGFGFGTETKLEIEFTAIEEDVNFLSVGVLF